MPSSTSYIRWVDVSLFKKLDALPFAFAAMLDDIADNAAQELQEYAQENAPWEDITGDARDGLTAEAEKGAQIVIALFHTVDYGPYLEVRWSGQYAIIMPTIEALGPSIMEKFSLAVIL